MPPRISDYGPADWLRLRPLIHGLKTRRYRASDKQYRTLPARAGDVTALRSAISDRKVLIAVAFNDPQTIAWQARLMQLYLPGVVYIVADNTADDGKAHAIADTAARAGVPYLRLPANPTNVPSRSHGLALNWIWSNLVRPGEPRVFGFLDDDLFPTAPDDPFASLATQDFFGVVRPGVSTATVDAAGRWFLWAGFSMFRFEAVRSKPLDFSQDWFLGLDTGGANWNVLYRHVARDSIREQPTVFTPFREGLQMTDAPFQWCGPWLHEVGLMGRPEFAVEKRLAVQALLEPHLAQADAMSSLER